MKKSIFAFLLLASFNGLAQKLNTLTSQEKKAGWKLLFDGKTMNGWRNFYKKDLGGAWQVSAVEKAITLDATFKEGWMAKGGGELTTDGIYENYEFTTDWKISEGGNSGIIFNAQEDDEKKHPYSWNTGPEFQVLDNEKHDDGKIPKHRAGNLYDIFKYEPENVKPQGQWNTAKIRQKNGHVELFLNGRKVIEYTIGSDEYKKAVAESKFKEDPMWGTYTKGHIVLQDHGNQVWYRNIKVRKI
jgi:hypothetical protein